MIAVSDVHAALARIVHFASLGATAAVAHLAEDQLHCDVLASIADGTCADPKGCASAALKSERITFERGCANGDAVR